MRYRLDRNLRRSALQKIALLSAKLPGNAGTANHSIDRSTDEDNDFGRLARECEPRKAPSENGGLLNGIMNAVVPGSSQRTALVRK